jgi:hypothetical protein
MGGDVKDSKNMYFHDKPYNKKVDFYLKKTPPIQYQSATGTDLCYQLKINKIKNFYLVLLFHTRSYFIKS